MKQFKTDYNGLLPILLDDIRFLQEAYDEQIEALIKPYLEFTDNNSFILSGVEHISGNNYSAGWIVLQGKVYRVPALSLPVSPVGYELNWVIQTQALAAGLKLPKRTSTAVNTYFEKTASVNVVPSPSAGVPFLLPRLAEMIRFASGLDGSWKTVTLINDWEHVESPEAPVQYKLVGGVIYLRGYIAKGSGTTSNQAIRIDDPSIQPTDYFYKSYYTHHEIDYSLNSYAARIEQFEGYCLIAIINSSSDATFLNGFIQSLH